MRRGCPFWVLFVMWGLGGVVVGLWSWLLWMVDIWSWFAGQMTILVLVAVVLLDLGVD